MLVLGANYAVPIDDLIDGLWADDPPPSAANLVQTYVSAWRKTLEPDRTRRGAGDRLVTVGLGYRLRIEATYAQARRLLAEELGADPGAGLRDMHARVLRQDPGLRPGAGLPRPAPRAGRAGANGLVPRQLPAGVGHFAGRATELKTLDGLLAEADDAGGGRW